MSEEKMHGNWKQDSRKPVLQWSTSIDARVRAPIGTRDSSAIERQIIETNKNVLLAGLSPIDRDLVAGCSELIPLVAGQILNDAVHQGRHVYFPISGSIALTVVLADGVTLEVGSVGRHGMTGYAAPEGEERQMSRAIVKSAGFAYRIKIEVWQREFRRSVALQQVLLMYNQTLMAQLTQIAACNRHHAVQQRFARWLLTTFDHAYPCKDLLVTQEFIATLLGVRREGITAAAGKLQADGAIRYTRGKVTMVDRAVLESQACECYEAIREYKLDDKRVHLSRTSAVMPGAQSGCNRSGYAN